MNRATQELAPSSLTERASTVMPAGGFGNFDPEVFIVSGKGSRVTDAAGREYIDYLIGSGPMLLGHGHPEVVEVVKEQVDRGMTFFANNPAGLELAEVICNAVACADQVRFVSTGGEADMYAMRLARAFTGREKILKFEGGYHGMSGEALQSLAPTKLADFPQAVPDSAGIPESVRQLMVIAPFNDFDLTRQLLDEFSEALACVIVEPQQRIVPPAPGFLEMLREETEKRGILLVFDEVVTGFRLSYGGAQSYYGVTPDVCTLGKVVGGGFPLAAIAGREDVMSHFDKKRVGDEGFMYQVGTLSGNPVAAAAGLKTLEILGRPGSYGKIHNNGKRIMDALTDSLSASEIPHCIVGEPPLFDVLFLDGPVTDYRDTISSDKHRASTFNRVLRENGILKPPQKIYSSLSLTEDDIAQTIDAIDAASRALVT